LGTFALFGDYSLVLQLVEQALSVLGNDSPDLEAMLLAHRLNAAMHWRTDPELASSTRRRLEELLDGHKLPAVRAHITAFDGYGEMKSGSYGRAAVLALDAHQQFERLREVRWAAGELNYYAWAVTYQGTLDTARRAWESSIDYAHQHQVVG